MLFLHHVGWGTLQTISLRSISWDLRGISRGPAGWLHAEADALPCSEEEEIVQDRAQSCLACCGGGVGRDHFNRHWTLKDPSTHAQLHSRSTA